MTRLYISRTVGLRTVVREQLFAGHLFARLFFAGNVVRGVSCSPDSYAPGQLAAQQSTVNCQLLGLLGPDKCILYLSSGIMSVIQDYRPRLPVAVNSATNCLYAPAFIFYYIEVCSMALEFIVSEKGHRKLLTDRYPFVKDRCLAQKSTVAQY